MSQKCGDCGAELYDSPNPLHKGEKEHFCRATQGMVIGSSKPKLVSESESKKKKST